MSISKDIFIYKKDFLKNNKLGKFLRESILSLKAEYFILNKSKNYSENLKFSIATVIFDSKDDNLFLKNLESLFSQNLEDVEVIIINNGAKENFLNKLNQYLNKKSNVTLIKNPIPQYEYKYVNTFDPVFGLVNLGLLIAKGELFSMVSWDDEISPSYCLSIYKKYIETGLNCFAPQLKTIDLHSNIINQSSEIIAKSFEDLPEVITAKKVIESRIYANKKMILNSPGELLAYQKEFLISRQGYDFDIDISQYLKNAAGEKIAIVKDATLFWRYHTNQAHNTSVISFNSLYIKREKEIYEFSDIYKIHLSSYGKEWAKEIKYYYKNTKIANLVSQHIILLSKEKKLSFKFFLDLKKELNPNLIFLIVKTLLNKYFSKFIYFSIYLIKNPIKLLRLNFFIKNFFNSFNK